MRLKRPHRASLADVDITREGEYAVITYKDPTVGGVHLKIGPKVERMTPGQILAVHNRVIAAQEQLSAEYEHVAVEIPPGRPQIKYEVLSDQWVPRGDVLRCVIADGGPDFETTIHIDDHELSLREFGRLLLVYNGWGMRVAFVPDDELHAPPQIEVREPDGKERKLQEPQQAFRGRWRITEMEQWRRDYLDLVVPAFIQFDPKGDNSFEFGTVRGWLECYYGKRGGKPLVEFSWQGTSDGDEACGRGWAVIDQHGIMRGHLFIHGSEDSTFAALKQRTRAK